MQALADLLKMPRVDGDYGFDLSPDGASAYFSWNREGSWEIYSVALAAGGAPHRLTAGPGAKFGPRLSPDGAALLYALDLDGGESFHLCRLDLASGASTDLTPGISFALQANFCWSPDGNWIACLADRDGQFDACILPAGGGALRKVFSSGRPCWDVAWSPDGRFLAVEAEMDGQARGVFLVPLQGGSPRRLEEHGIALNAQQPAWLEDGRLAVSARRGQRDAVAVFDPRSGRIAWRSWAQADDQQPAGVRGADNLVFSRSRGPRSWLEVRSNGRAQRVSIGRGRHYAPAFTPDGRRLVFLYESPTCPPGLRLVDLPSLRVRALTPEAGLPSGLRLQVRHVTYPGLDGVPVPALLFLMSAIRRPAPAVIVIHGGPTAHSQFEWDPFICHLLGQGWIVLAPNYRGSTGYGQDWQLASRFDMGGVDADDCAAGAVYLVSSGLADPARVAVTGRSHGGFLTMACLTRYPHLWAGGSAVVPFLNWFTSHAASRDDLKHWDIENMGDPRQHEARWRSHSPFFLLDQVRAPVQLICGENDPRCPPGESLSARDRLLSLGRQVDLHLYAGEGHVFLKEENVLDAEARRADFLRTLLAQG